MNFGQFSSLSFIRSSADILIHVHVDSQLLPPFSFEISVCELKIWCVAYYIYINFITEHLCCRIGITLRNICHCICIHNNDCDNRIFSVHIPLQVNFEA